MLKICSFVFRNAQIGIAFDLSGYAPAKLKEVLDMLLLDAQELLALKAKSNFLEW